MMKIRITMRLLAMMAVLGLAACGQPTVSDRIGEQARNSGVVDMARAAEFAWTQVRIYTPYSTRQAVCKDLGELAPDCLKESPASVAEGEFLLVFVNEGKGARYEPHHRSNGHFLYHTGVLALQRHAAVLDVVPGGLKIVECADGVTEAELRAATEATIVD